MKHHLSLITFIFLLTSSATKAQDYIWGEEFKEGDIISAETFNQIFGTLQKINQTIVDADLVGTWTCESIYTGGIGGGSAGWTTASFLQVLKNSQVTLTASNAGNSESGPYSISTSSPNPISARDSADRNAAFTGTYILKNNNMYIKHGSANSIFRYSIDLISPSRFTATLSPGMATSAVDTFSCDSAIAVPAAPSATTATNAQTLVNVTWTDNSTDETGFKIYRRLSNEAEATLLATAVTMSPYSDSTLSEGETAFYSVTAYNDNGESAKSKVVSTTLDSIKPTVVSHLPINNQQVAKSNTTISITFSENITILCSGDNGNCSGDEQGILVTSEKNGSQSYVNFKMGPVYKLVYSGSNSQVFEGNDIITVKVRKDFIKDAFGNYMNEDYVYTFITGP